MSASALRHASKNVSYSLRDVAVSPVAAAARDPWKERDRPATVNQFRSALPVVG